LQQIPAPGGQSAAVAPGWTLGAREELDALGEHMDQMFEQLKQDEPRDEIPSETDHAPPLG